MPGTRQLTDEERAIAKKILEDIEREIGAFAGDDEELFWAVRRYIYKQLTYGERGKPMERKNLKNLKWKKQRGICDRCKGELPERGAELDRIDPMKGYTEQNTRLLCHTCHIEEQELRGYH